jgi:hypothetical protein
MPDPVFTEADRVGANSSLPSELVGMTPAQIAAHYQQENQRVRQAAQQAIASASAGPPQPATPRVSQADFDNDPAAATRSILSTEGVTRTEFQQLTGAARETLVRTAKFQASQGKPYWNRFSSQIEQIAQGSDPMALLDASFWETCYNAVIGQNIATIQNEERAAAQAAASASSEGVSNGSTPPPAPRMLTQKEMAICDGLGITHDQFRRGEENMQKNVFPVTLDNRRR